MSSGFHSVVSVITGIGEKTYDKDNLIKKNKLTLQLPKFNFYELSEPY